VRIHDCKLAHEALKFKTMERFQSFGARFQIAPCRLPGSLFEREGSDIAGLTGRQARDEGFEFKPEAGI